MADFSDVSVGPRGPDIAETAPGFEATLVRQARDGDEAAFEALARRHQDRAYRIALRMTGNAHDAHDVVQDSLVHAWRGLPRYRGDSGFATWLTRIVINRCHNQGRDNRHYELLPADDHPALSAAGADTRVEADHQRIAVMSAIAELPFDQRSALVLRAFDGCTYAEIAGILGVTENTAKVRVHRARRALTASLASWR